MILERALTLRAAREADVDELTQLVDVAYRPYIERLGRLPGPMTADYAAVIRDRDVTVVDSDAGIVGVIVLSLADDGFTIDNVAVHPSRRGEGVGRALLEFAEGEARRAGFDSIELYTHEKLTENLALYARIGYVEYDRRSRGDFSLVFMGKRIDGADRAS